jgi:putative ABC transport system substrate-binding protein
VGYVEGQNVAFEYRWANDQYDRVAPLAAELARRPVTVMVVSGGNVAVVAAKSATSTIPIVFTGVADPVKGGLVASLNRPGGNLTGVALLTIELDAKRLELLHSLVPAGGAIGALVNPKRPDANFQLRELEGAARRVGRPLVVLRASSEQELDTVFSTLDRRRISALVVGADPFFAGRRARRRVDHTPRRSRHLPVARLRPRRRAHELRAEPGRRLSPGRNLRGTDHQG